MKVTETWTYEDIQALAMKKYGRRLTEETAYDIMFDLQHCEKGINWNVIEELMERQDEDYHALEFVPLSITVRLKNGFDGYEEAVYTYENVTEEEAIAKAKREWMEKVEAQVIVVEEEK